MTKIILPGRPVPKKNSPLALPGRNLVLPSKAWRAYERLCLGTVRRPGPLMAWGNICYTVPVRVTALYWLPDRRWWPDLVGLLQGTSDLLEKAGILENDRLIQSYDGSRLVGLDKENPRAEITITTVELSLW